MQTIYEHSYIKIKDFCSIKDTRGESIDRGEYVNIFMMSLGQRVSSKSAVSPLLLLGEKRVGAEIRQMTRPNLHGKMLTNTF